MKKEMMVKSLDAITYKTFKEAVTKIVAAPITSRAPLGYSSDTTLLYGTGGEERRNGVSVRNHSGNLSMLICDRDGRFIFHGGFSIKLPAIFIARELFKTFKKVRKHLEG
ncbi:MAG: hypothetical protein EOO42_18320 [Flavobacteriales bacterium]|nr:MAG: hypothetical protein EOO42_18320 [Flavobacteriales bacterium]